MTQRRGIKCALHGAAIATLLSACAAGPDYQRPQVDIPVTWNVEAPWRQARPSDASDKGAWWRRFGDPTLDRLQEQVLAANPTLAIATARLAQARAAADASSAGLFPALTAGTRASRFKISGNRPLTNYASPQYSTVQNDYALSFNASYEVDLFGRVQRSLEGARASAEQSAADLANTRLLLTTELAANYVNLRALDTEIDVVNRSVALQRRALDLITARYDGGAASGLEVAQQQALLDNTLTQTHILAKQRAQFEHAIASLTGTPAPVFSLPPQPLSEAMTPPAIPLGVPSDLLERRPDIAAAERAMAAANAQIGVATAAFYPSVILNPSVGFDSREIATLFDAPSLLWSIGVSATQSLFDAGRTRANVDFARAGYEATVGNYRRVVLGAMQEVQDGITGLAALDQATAQSQTAVADARRVLDMAADRYGGGATTYLDVITAQQAVLNTERQAAQLTGQRLLVSVLLVKALGGDWVNADAQARSAVSHGVAAGAAPGSAGVPAAATR
ncbi:efflux transporter outer membrane subunit [Bordetella flabilis]|uniref:RND transporter n=1 Tax=Bordetella flabilis TaxID=463014 RepID=A0A193GFC6_9BORD|nr:efflux transporter outer membrane subunit [Bordetella flabilis]ANN78156.1 RND transporter [Bordetella flabilis]